MFDASGRPLWLNNDQPDVIEKILTHLGYGRIPPMPRHVRRNASGHQFSPVHHCLAKARADDGGLEGGKYEAYQAGDVFGIGGGGHRVRHPVIAGFEGDQRRPCL